MFPALRAVKHSDTAAPDETAEPALSAFRQMVDQMPINVMTCDLSTFEINYANRSTIDTLRQLEHILPIKAHGLLGTCIDIFHKDPSH
ncbi:MAG TPA: GGDEF-domain containing protein, partial [Alphaproteobacteria bacterium]|nr:GGDEF-domain containing protein [Alphaproteobacteria bacterium]